MLKLEDISLLCAASKESLHWLASQVHLRSYRRAEVMSRAGDPGREVLLIAEGAAKIDLDLARPGRQAVVLGPGQSIGEMAIVSGLPVSATVTAIRDTVVYVVGREGLEELLRRDPIVYRSIAQMLADRLRHRTGTSVFDRSAVVLLVHDQRDPSSRRIADALIKGVLHYAPMSDVLGPCVEQDDVMELIARIDAWRTSAIGERYLLVRLSPPDAERLCERLHPADLVMPIMKPAMASGQPQAPRHGPAEVHAIQIGSRSALKACDDAWAFVVSEAEGDAAWHQDAWRRNACPEMDRIARYVTCREVGVAMSVGAAAGLAHFGVLEVLEQAGVPLDFLCGSSMGGLAALGYALVGDARTACEIACRHLGANQMVKDATWLPRSSLLLGNKVRQLREEIFGTSTFCQLECPAAVVAADLAAGQRVVISRGLVADAVHATSAIPGLFPPLVRDGRVLADGGIVTRVPVDLLSSRRCGYRIAVIVQPRVLTGEAERAHQARVMEDAIARPLGLRSVLGASWKLLGWWDSQSQARQADAVITVSTPAADGFNFDAGSRLVELGRAQAQERADDIKRGMDKALTPGIP